MPQTFHPLFASCRCRDIKFSSWGWEELQNPVLEFQTLWLPVRNSTLDDHLSILEIFDQIRLKCIFPTQFNNTYIHTTDINTNRTFFNWKTRSRVEPFFPGFLRSTRFPIYCYQPGNSTEKCIFYFNFLQGTDYYNRAIFFPRKVSRFSNCGCQGWDIRRLNGILK